MGASILNVSAINRGINQILEPW